MKELFKTIFYIPLYNILIWITGVFPGHSLGWSVIILTALIRFAIAKPSAKSTESQRKLRELQPKIDKIRKEIKDPQEQAQKTMALYRDNGVSPFGSCLPLLIQFPLFIAFYYAVRLISTNGVDANLLYSFVKTPEHINTVWLGIELTKPELWVLPIITGVLQLIQTLQMQPPRKLDKKASASQQAMQQMMYVMPLIIVVFARSLPSALPLYWSTSSLFTIIQQYLVDKKQKGSKGGKGLAKKKASSKGLSYSKNKGVEVVVRKKKS